MIGTSTEVANAILNITDPANNNFPNNGAEAGQKWGDVVDVLGAAVIPVSTTASAARAAFAALIATINNNSDGLSILKNAFHQYSIVLATGMTGAGFIGTPPPIEPPLEIILTGPTHDATPVANNLASLLVAWLKTGTATPISGGSPILWS